MYRHTRTHFEPSPNAPLCHASLSPQTVGVSPNGLNFVDLSSLHISQSAYLKLMLPLSLLPVRVLSLEGTCVCVCVVGGV